MAMPPFLGHMTAHDHLDDLQLLEVDTLLKQCAVADGNTIPIYPHLLKKQRAPSSILLYHQDEQLIGFLSVYFFYESGCELALMVSPQYRLKGIGRALLQTIIPILKAQDIRQIYFSTSIARTEWLLAKGLRYDYSEYAMHWFPDTPLLPPQPGLQIRIAHHADIVDLNAIDAVCFPEQAHDMSQRFEKLLTQKEYQIFIVEYQSQLIGKAHLFWDGDKVQLLDIAILPAFQHQGFGGALITHCLQHGVIHGCALVSLSVMSSNQKALDLYKKLGFSMVNTCDYFIFDFLVRSIH